MDHQGDQDFPSALFWSYKEYQELEESQSMDLMDEVEWFLHQVCLEEIYQIFFIMLKKNIIPPKPIMRVLWEIIGHYPPTYSDLFRNMADQTQGMDQSEFIQDPTGRKGLLDQKIWTRSQELNDRIKTIQEGLKFMMNYQNEDPFHQAPLLETPENQNRSAKDSGAKQIPESIHVANTSSQTTESFSPWEISESEETVEILSEEEEIYSQETTYLSSETIPKDYGERVQLEKDILTESSPSVLEGGQEHSVEPFSRSILQEIIRQDEEEIFAKEERIPFGNSYSFQVDEWKDEGPEPENSELGNAEVFQAARLNTQDMYNAPPLENQYINNFWIDERPLKLFRKIFSEEWYYREKLEN